jgi:hypothetical protein
MKNKYLKPGKEKLDGVTQQKLRKLLLLKKHNDGRYDLFNTDSGVHLVRNSLLTGPNTVKIGKSYYKSSRIVYTYFYGDIPNGHCIKFLDGDTSNFDLGNFLCTTNKAEAVLSVKTKIEEDSDKEEFSDTILKGEEIVVKDSCISRNSLKIVNKEEKREILKTGDIFTYKEETYILCYDGICANLTTGRTVDLRILFGCDDEDEAITRDYVIHKDPKLVL